MVTFSELNSHTWNDLGGAEVIQRSSFFRRNTLNQLKRQHVARNVTIVANIVYVIIKMCKISMFNVNTLLHLTKYNSTMLPK